jgi:hypothetical protein
MRFNQNYTYSQNKLYGIFDYEEQITLNGLFSPYKKNITAEMIVVDTDYYNYMLLYTCIQRNHFWVSEKSDAFYLFIKTRYFDSLRKIIPLFSKLRSLKIDLNKLAMIENSILSCPAN